MAAVLTPLCIVVFLGLYLAPIGITRAQEPVPVPGRGDMSNEQCSYCRKWKVECGHRNGRGDFDVPHSALVTVIIATPRASDARTHRGIPAAGNEYPMAIATAE